MPQIPGAFPGPTQDGGLRPPPVTPPDVPSLATYPGPSAQAAGDGRSDIVQKLVFQIEQALDVLAEMVPEGSDLADQAKGLIRQTLKTGLGMAPMHGGRSSLEGPMTGGM